MMFVAALAPAAVAQPQPPPPDELATQTIVFARGQTLIKSDGKGRNETEFATLPAQATVRALRTDALGKILLVDLGGKWLFMPLDGTTKTLTELPCDAGPAQLAEDGTAVLCRAKQGGGSIIYYFATNKTTAPLAIPALGARMIGTPADRKLIWADKGAVWSSPAYDLKKAKQVAKTAPLRSFLPSPDGVRAVGVFADEIFVGRERKPAEVLMTFALDGEGARRKAIQSGVPVEWSHDGKWVLVQDKTSACIMLAVGGEYKCWKGYTALGLSPDGKYALLLGNREKKSDSKKDKKKKGKKDKEPEPEENGAGDEHGDAPMPVDDVPVPPPSGPLSLYRAELHGPFAKSPALVARAAEGSAVWIPTSATLQGL